MADEKVAKQPPRTYVEFNGRRKRGFVSVDRLEALRKDHPDAFVLGNSVRPDRIQIEGSWYALELPDDDGRRWLVRLK
jgi:hypothetical protein